ncbi:LysM peptidoglycan-binding domain-containing protein [Nocardioides jiangxiensis]|uniref:LysM peptidoglycan-binding domain-containing protein n=1 Tax=Nocardioides jiangxiensis TaxID=3064524 RepID=A0ABT9AYI8_9ACTN|nr:LysM peptidoglycan-binding domain-containing protein [Nocardioides sp. WY-20]MDO7867642.1 LysM peptidoglycan-binding domain-containing protein [Nocardioides sp. WY-20]
MSTISFAPTFEIRPARTGPAPAGQLRLTRRGRLVVFMGAVLVVFALAFVIMGGSSASTDAGGSPTATERIVVAPGQTLWDIASAHSDGDVRATVDAIEKLNALDGAMLYAGQELYIPVD